MFVVTASPHASELLQILSDSFDLPISKDDHLNDAAPGAFNDLMKIENTFPFSNTYKVIQGDLRSMNGNAFYSVIVAFFCCQHRFTTDNLLIILIRQYEFTIKHVDIVIYR